MLPPGSAESFNFHSMEYNIPDSTDWFPMQVSVHCRVAHIRVETGVIGQQVFAT
jgi:hypothetical protein